MKYTISIVCAIAIGAVACTSIQNEPITDNYYYIQPIVTPVAIQNEYVAQIQSVKNVEIRSRVNGYIDKIHVDEGMHVKSGQPLFSIHSKQFEQAVMKERAIIKSIEAEIKSAKVELTNVESLVSKNIISTTELELAKAKMEALQAKLEEARINEQQAAIDLSFTTLKAPFDGIINRIPNKPGSLVEEGSILTTISDNSHVFAYFNVSERDYLDFVLREGKYDLSKVRLILANNAPYQHIGTIETIESEFDANTGNIAFRAKFPNPDGYLKHGAHGKVVSESIIESPILIPQRSTFEIQDKVFVYVVNNDSTLEQRNVVPSRRLPHFYVVESGIGTSEKILFEGHQNVSAGMKVSCLPYPEDQLTMLLENQAKQ